MTDERHEICERTFCQEASETMYLDFDDTKALEIRRGYMVFRMTTEGTLEVMANDGGEVVVIR